MARRTTKKKTSGISLDFSNVSKAFEPKQEYAVRVTEATLEEGTKAPYFNLKLQGVEGSDYENSTMYHRASCSESSLWRLRPLLEAFGFDIPEGPLDLDAEDFVGREAMCSTFLDRYDGGSSVKPDEFWALDGDASEGDDDTDEEFDLDELEDEQIEALGEALKVKGKTPAAIKKALAKLDQEDVAAAFAELETTDEEGDDESEEFDLDELDDDKVLELAKALKVKASNAKKARAALAKLDQEDVAAAYAELEEDEEEEEEKPKGKAAKGKASKGKKKAVTEDDIQEMSEEELEAVIEQFELDVDLSDHKTLRKMKNAVIDAMEEGDHFAG